ncbi:MAG: amidohydrolase family protein [Salinibacterium sp.]|nr:amidohydrolase family protein [Salinibacterium sp.]
MSVRVIRARTLLAAGEPPRHDAAVVINDDVIGWVGDWSDLAGSVSSVTEVDGVVSPGFVDAHSHLRGIPLDEHGLPARQFEAWICSLAAASDLDPHDEALVAGVGLLETGVTAVQGFVDASADEQTALDRARAAARGLASTGIRSLLVLGFADRALRAPEPALDDWELVSALPPLLPASSVARVAREWLDQNAPARTEYGIGPVGGQWSSDALLEALASCAGNHRVHTHLHESRHHRDWLAGAQSPLERLRSTGLLNDRLSGAHGVHLRADELDLIAASGASLVHCPASNEALHVGRAGVAEWLSRGIPAGIGIDSQNVGAPDMFEVMRATLATAHHVDDPISAEQAFMMATTGGSHALGIAGGGRIAAGSPADLIALDLEASTVDDLVANGSADCVRSVWVAGAPVVVDGRSTVDASAARTRLTGQLASDRVAREERLAKLADTLDLVEQLAEARR